MGTYEQLDAVFSLPVPSKRCYYLRSYNRDYIDALLCRVNDDTQRLYVVDHRYRFPCTRDVDEWPDVHESLNGNKVQFTAHSHASGIAWEQVLPLPPPLTTCEIACILALFVPALVLQLWFGVDMLH